MQRTLCAMALIAVAFPALAQPIQQGDRAPEFAARTVSGKTLRLADLRGKVVLLDFWAVDCPPCRIEMPVLERWHKQYAGRGFVVLGITEMNPKLADVRKALKQRGITYAVALDPGEKIGKLYKLEAHPTTILIDRTGKVVKAETGYLKGDEKPIEQAMLPLLRSKQAKRQ